MNPNQQLPQQHGGQSNGYPLVAAAMPQNANGAMQQSIQMYQNHLVGVRMPHILSSAMTNPGSFLAMHQTESYGGMEQFQSVNSASAQYAIPMQTNCNSTQVQQHHFNQTPHTLTITPPIALACERGFATTTTGSIAAVFQKTAAGMRSPDVQGENVLSEFASKEQTKQNLDRNREHARTTRQRKKAFVLKLRDLVEGFHAERNEEARKHREGIQRDAELQRVRCEVVQTFLHFHSMYERDEQKWSQILEDDFWLKQPVTPYRSFRRSEIEKVCRSNASARFLIRQGCRTNASTSSFSSLFSGMPYIPWSSGSDMRCG
jgi:hypothetical protein